MVRPTGNDPDGASIVTVTERNDSILVEPIAEVLRRTERSALTV